MTPQQNQRTHGVPQKTGEPQCVLAPHSGVAMPAQS